MPDETSPDPIGLVVGSVPEPRRPGRRRLRDRHGRGIRGPALGDTPFAPGGVPARRNRADRFDDVALRVMRAVVAPWVDQLGDVELAVEEVPVLGDEWAAGSVPLASYVERRPGVQPRLVLFRRPLEHRAESAYDLESLLLTVIVEQLAEVLGLPAEDVHPGYEAD